MSKLQVDTIVNKNDDGAPTLTRGAVVTGVITATGANVTGIVTATSFNGSGSNLTGITGKAAAMSIVFGG
jgi:hypothetical protein